MAYDLTKPAFGPEAEKVSKPAEPETPAVVEEEKVEEPEASEEVEEEESTVKYSRFKSVNERRKEAETRAAEAEAELQRLRSQSYTPQRTEETTDIPSYWKELYGDSEASQKAWRIQERAQDELTERARREAVEAVRQAQYEEVAKVQENVDTLDENFEELSALVGRDLNAKEQSVILDIVDEFTPKDDQGNYLGAILPFEKAWEIHEMRSEMSKAPKRSSRDAVASLTGSGTQGEPSNQSEADKNFNPLDWGAYKRRI